MNRISVAQKMLLIAALFTFPIILLVVVLYGQIKGDVDFASQEQLGVTYTRAFKPLLLDLEAVRSVSKSDRDAVDRRVEADFTTLHGFDRTVGAALAVMEPLKDLQKSWTDKQPVGTVIGNAIAFLSTVSDNSKITLDPILDGYYVGDTMVNKGPGLIDGIAQSRVLGLAALRSNSLNQSDRIAVTVISGQMSGNIDGIAHNVPIAIGAAPTLKASLGAAGDRVHTSATAYVGAIQSKLLTAQQLTADPTAFSNQAGEAGDAAVALYDASISGMRDVLQMRIDGLVHRETIIFTVVLALIAGAALMMLVTTRSLSRRLGQVTYAMHRIADEDMRHLADLASAVSNGDIRTRTFLKRDLLEATGSDEVAILSRSYNALVERVDTVGTDFNRMTLFLSSLITGVSDAASRLVDVTVDMTGAISAVDNEIRDIAVASDGVAEDARSQSLRLREARIAVTEISRTASQIAEGADQQSKAVVEATVGVEGLDVQIGHVSTLGTSLATSALRSAKESINGAKSVRETAETVTRLRAESEVLQSIMLSLEERSHAVVEIVSVIEDIAVQTNLLALNAAIEAARAGVHGRGFSVVADEVRKLAERSSSSTREIGTILNSIRAETVRAAGAMRNSSTSMDSGILIAERASASLDEIARAIEDTRRISVEVSDATSTMKTMSARVADHMGNVSGVVEENAAAARQLEASGKSVDETIGAIDKSAAQQSEVVGRFARSTDGIATETRRIVAVTGKLRQSAKQLLSLIEHSGDHQSAIASTDLANHALQEAL
jgi:methyl-accepting chemotaxis protein